MNFLNFNLTYAVIAISVVCLVLLAVLYGNYRRRRLLHAICDARLVPRLVSNVCTGKRHVRDAFFVAAVVFIMLAAARPWWGTRMVPAPARSRDVVVALDVSRSMLAEDIAPNRLKHATWFTRQIIQRSAGDRFGLVVFAGEAFLQCPLTQDRNTLLFYLNDISTESISVGGTDLSRALQESLNAFEGAEGRDRAILLITDGDELQGNALSQVNILKEQNTKLFIVGVGSPNEEALVQLEDRTYLRDADGDLVRTRLDETRLRELARAADGAYVRSTATAPNLAPIASQIQALIPQQSDATTTLRPVERFQIPLAIALLCLILRLCLGERVRSQPPTVAAATLVLLLAVVSARADNMINTAPGRLDPAGAPLAGGSDAPTAPEDDQPPAMSRRIAETLGELETAKGPDRSRLLYNLGVFHQQDGDLKQAQSYFHEALNSSDPGSQVYALTLWNQGLVHQLRGRQALQKDDLDTALSEFEKAGEDYREALPYQVGTTGLARNQELLLMDIRHAQEAKERLAQLQQKLERARKETEDALKEHRQLEEKKESADVAQQAQQAAGQTREAKSAAMDLGNFLDTLPQQPKDAPAMNPGHLAAERLQNAADQQERAAQAVRTDESRQQALASAGTDLAEAARLLGIEENQQQEQQQQKQDSPKQDRDQQAKQKDEPDSSEQQTPPENEQDTEQSEGDLMEQLAQQEQEENQQAESQSAQIEAGKLDPGQARALLMKMQEQERDLQRELKARQRTAAELSENEKNW